MLASMIKTGAATAAYGLVHSALSGRAAKRGAARLLGDRAAGGLYRAFFQAQSFATLAALVTYIRSLPDVELYRAGGLTAVALRGGQAAALAWAGWSVAEIGLNRFAGLDGLAALASGAPEVPPPAEGHGPEPGEDGTLRVAGPFRQSRHPVHLAFPLLTWLQPRMTTNLLAYNVVASVYFVVGAAREEARLRQVHGPAYGDYQRSGVPFYLPSVAAGPKIA
jgi:hypothetical protein